jgi:acyl transferase domain-containing protein
VDRGVERLAAEGATAFVEVGPGRVLGTAATHRQRARGQSVEDPPAWRKR